MLVMQLTGEPITIVDVPLPVARLPLDVEGETRRATDGRQADGARQAGPVAPENGLEAENEIQLKRGITLSMFNKGQSIRDSRQNC